MINMRNIILKAVVKHAEGHVAKHVAKCGNYLNHSVGIGEHSDIVEAIEVELDHIAKYQDQIDIFRKKWNALTQNLRLDLL